VPAGVRSCSGVTKVKYASIVSSVEFIFWKSRKSAGDIGLRGRFSVVL
jgi:hypothetical protein